MNLVGLLTLARREIKRTFKIINQVIWPPLVSTMLYLFIFGYTIGARIDTVQGLPYLQFLIPGLIALNVIEGSYGESSASLFIGRFTNSIQEILVAPLSYFEMVLGFLAGSVLRGLIIGNLIMLLGFAWARVLPEHWVFYLLFMAAMSALFSAIGLSLALFAESFDQLAIPTTFFITPLIFFGGVFHSVLFLPPALQTLSFVNPLFYLIDGFRWTMTGASIMPFWTNGLVLLALLALAITVTFALFRRGYKLRT